MSDGVVSGTLWHGGFESDGFRRAFLTDVAERVGSRWRPDPAAPGFAERRETMLDRLADAIVEHCDTDALRGLVGQ